MNYCKEFAICEILVTSNTVTLRTKLPEIVEWCLINAHQHSAGGIEAMIEHNGILFVDPRLVTVQGGRPHQPFFVTQSLDFSRNCDFLGSLFRVQFPDDVKSGEPTGPLYRLLPRSGQNWQTLYGMKPVDTSKPITFLPRAPYFFKGPGVAENMTPRIRDLNRLARKGKKKPSRGKPKTTEDLVARIFRRFYNNAENISPDISLCVHPKASNLLKELGLEDIRDLDQVGEAAQLEAAEKVVRKRKMIPAADKSSNPSQSNKRQKKRPVRSSSSTYCPVELYFTEDELRKMYNQAFPARSRKTVVERTSYGELLKAIKM